MKNKEQVSLKDYRKMELASVMSASRIEPYGLSLKDIAGIMKEYLLEEEIEVLTKELCKKEFGA